MEELNENQADDPSRKFNLKFGYREINSETKEEILHTEVVIGHKITIADFIKASDDTGNSEFQFTNELIRASITKFGSLETPLSMTVFLSLDETDREMLLEELNLFTAETLKQNSAKVTDNSQVQLTFGIMKDGENFEEVEFGKTLTGYDQLALEKVASGKEMLKCLTLIKHIKNLRTLDGSRVFEGDLKLEDFKDVVIGDYFILQAAENKWLDSVRGS